MELGLYKGDCLDWLRSMPDACVDSVVTDPPYPEIDRDYGRLTEAQWTDLIHEVCIESRRVLKPSGSAMFVLQPNSRKVGSMRGWLWEFMAWVCREWNMVQDVWWWNITAMPTVHATQHGLMRPSLKSIVWCGDECCYRNQSVCLWLESDRNIQTRLSGRCGVTKRPSGHRQNISRMSNSAKERGGVTPFNVWPVANTNSTSSAGAFGHGAGTPMQLTRKMMTYITPPGGLAIDPFLGSGTTAVAAIAEGRRWAGAEITPEYWPIIEARVAHAEREKAQELPFEEASL